MKPDKEKDLRLARLVEALKGYEPEQIILFGSRARGEADDFSDYDLVVIKKTDKPFMARLKEMVHYIKDFDGAVEALVYTPEEFAELQEVGLGWVIRHEGQVLYDCGGSGDISLAHFSGTKAQRSDNTA